MRRWGPLTASCLLAASACKTTGATGVKAAGSAGSDFVSVTTAAAAELTQRYNDYAIQTNTDGTPDCHSLVVPADAAAPFVGTVVLFHGYTACPQQFMELATILAKKGVQTYAPLLPGQGRSPAPTPDLGAKVDGQALHTYYGAYLPSVRNDDWQRYQRFVEDVNAFVTTLPGDKFVGGLSVGGSLATYAYANAPGLYRRALLLSPFYGVAGTYAGRHRVTDSGVTPGLKRMGGDLLYHFEDWILKDLLKDMKLVGGQKVSWGDGCYKKTLGTPEIPGRRGICDSLLQNVAAVHKVGGTVMEAVAKQERATIPQVQYIFAEFDPTADTLLMRRAAAQQAALAGDDRVKLCTFSHEIPHSFFARSDIFLNFPDPYWLNAFLQMSSNFIAFGEAIRLDADHPSEEVAYDAAANQDIAQSFLQRCDTARLAAYDDVYKTK